MCVHRVYACMAARRQHLVNCPTTCLVQTLLQLLSFFAGAGATVVAAACVTVAGGGGGSGGVVVDAGVTVVDAVVNVVDAGVIYYFYIAQWVYRLPIPSTYWPKTRCCKRDEIAWKGL